MAAPIPPLSAYQAWFDAQALTNPRRVGRDRLQPATYRRLAIMRRSGESFSTIGAAIGRTMDGAKTAWARLPEELR